MKDISAIRRQYAGLPLRKSDLSSDPLDQFDSWMQEAIDAEIAEPIGMTLGTVTRDGSINLRIVLLREYSQEGYVFYTNYLSDKAKEMQSNPGATIHFFWEPLHRQVKIRGTIEKVPTEVSDAYFASRPRAHQIGAWASEQSKVISSREELDDRVSSFTDQFEGKTVPRPPHWGGFILKPDTYEFWQGRENRLHDRFRYLMEDGTWALMRLAP